MERRRGATGSDEMSFINGGLCEKTVFGCNNNSNINDMREKRESSSFPSYLTAPPTSDRHPHHHHFLAARCTIVDDSSELSIFDAKKYFNEVSANNNNINKVSPMANIIDPTMMPMSEQCVIIGGDHLTSSKDQDYSDQDSELLSKSKPRTTCGGVAHPSSAVASRLSPTSASIDGYRRSYRARSFHSATPTASSEASWNSQTGLLSNPPGAISVSVLRGDSDHHSAGRKARKPASPSSAATRPWIFRSSKCPCSGKKSVQVQESKVILDPKTSPPPYINNNTTAVGGHSQSQPESPSSEKTSGENTMLLQHSNNDVVWSSQRRFPPNLIVQGHTTQRVIASSTGFTFPILKNNTNNNGDIPTRPINHVLIQDPPRDSLEVFKPSTTRDGGSGGSLKSRILASVAATGGNATIVSDIDDVASDASSDLFEIESFSTQTASTTTASYPAMFHRRDSMELEARRLGGLAAAATRRSLDEPMTPSTDWYEPSEASIDWSVTTAEGFDRASIANMSEAEEPWTEKNSSNNINSSSNTRRRSSSGNGLLSCRSEKAVNVGPQPVTKHVGSRPPLGKKPPLARSNSAHLSLTFAA